MADKKEQYLYNPYQIKGIIERPIRRDGMTLSAIQGVDPNSGEAIPLYTPQQNSVVLHDEKTYTKAFAEAGDIIGPMNDAEKNLILYILMKLRPNRDTIYLSQDDVLLWCGFSRSAFYRAKDGLIEKDVLARRVGSSMEFFINPNIFYNGDRVRLLRSRKQSP